MNGPRRALEILRFLGWCKGTMWRADGSRCIMGALTLYWGSLDQDLDAISDVIHEQYPERIETRTNRSSCIVPFNDHPDTTFADVERVLEKAALKIDEAVS